MNNEIRDWLCSQHEWLQEAALRILKQGTLGSADVSDLVSLIKSPPVPAGNKRTFPTIGASASKTNLRLVSMGPIVGIDALAPRKPLEFGSGNLVAVYGKNGAGKSGYARIISKACGKPHSTELKTNVYKPAPAESKCSFKYQVDGAEKDCEWLANSNPVEELRSVDVFDSDSGRLYLERDNEVSYVPPELALFADLVDACKQVEAALTSEQSKLVSTLPKLPGQFASCAVASRYQGLQAEIDTKKLRELTTWGPEDEAQLIAQQERLKVKDPAGAARRRREVMTQINALLAALRKAVKALGEDALTALRKLSADAAEKRKAATEGAKALGSMSSLEEIGSTTWRALWEAARAYSIAEGYPNRDFPFTGDESRCVLCHQELDEATKQRLEGFEGFVKGKLESDAETAEKQLKECMGWLPNRPTDDALVTTCQAADLPEGMCERIQAAWDLLEGDLADLRLGKIPEKTPLIDDDVVTVGKELVALSEAAEAAAKELDADAKSPDRADAANKQLELEARKWVTQQADAIQAEVKRLKLVSQYADWKKKTTTNAISLQAGRVSQQVVTDAYIARFNDELQKLGAQRIEVELAKAGAPLGRSKHRVRLKGLVVDGAKISDVLSEGERRMVALASFLADVTGREGSSPFVFDDPISSLDQDFEEFVMNGAALSRFSIAAAVGDLGEFASR